MKKTLKKSYRLSHDVVKIIEQVAQRTGLSTAKIIERAVVASAENSTTEAAQWAVNSTPAERVTRDIASRISTHIRGRISRKPPID